MLSLGPVTFPVAGLFSLAFDALGNGTQATDAQTICADGSESLSVEKFAIFGFRFEWVIPGAIQPAIYRQIRSRPYDRFLPVD
jgi:hypothetical protein